MNDKIPSHKLSDFSKGLKSWSVVQDHHLFKQYMFKNFVEALAFVNKIGEVAEELQHHPNINFTWGKVEVTIYTHDVDGLTAKDFSLAKRIDEASL